MKIAVVGSRNWRDNLFIEERLMREFKNYPDNPEHQLTYEDITIISGGAKGVDTIAEDFAKNFVINKLIFKPDWEKHGKKAGFLRNQQIVDESDKLIAFWDGESKGTKHSIDLAIKKGIPVDIYIRK